ncbi:class II aldolase/adducin family protein [Klebsiella pneumoniae]
MFVIKPSGVEYARDDRRRYGGGRVWPAAKVVEGSKKPSSDTPTHLPAVPGASPTLGGIVHTHSRHATIWAQAGQSDLPRPGALPTPTTFTSPVPCTQPDDRMRRSTATMSARPANVIVETFRRAWESNPAQMPGGAGPFPRPVRLGQERRRRGA